jgi:ABC-type transport system substrate-binding protein
VYGGNAVQSTQLLLPNVPGFDPQTPYYQFDLASCEKEFKLADIDKDGIPAGEDPDDIWETGFQFKAIYTSGDFTQNISKILSENIKGINPKFIVTPTFLPYSAYYDARKNGQFPIAVAGWIEDIHDPYNWFQPFTTGYFGKQQSLPDDLKAQFQEIFNRGLAETDPVKRAEIYNEASLLYYNEAVGVPLALTTDDYFWQRSIQGMTLNPFFPDSYFYPVSKE